MIPKLRIVIVDDDAASMEMMAEYCKAVPYVEVAGKFGNEPICT